MTSTAALRLTTIVPVIAVMITASGLWRTPHHRGHDRVASPRVYESVLVQVDVQQPADRFRWEAETMGLVAALLEGGLSSVEGVTARIEGTPVAPGLDVATDPDGIWTASVRLDGEPEALEAEMLLCDPQESCVPLVVRGNRDAPEDMARELIVEVAKVMGRPNTVAPAWAREQSRDSYAQLLAGRAAAVWYGLYPAPPPELRGDVRQDPYARAVYLDPTMPVAQWVAARKSLEEGDALSAEEALRRGSDAFPDPVMQVAYADVLLDLGEPDAALREWDRLSEELEDDPRLVFGRIDALIAAGRVHEAARDLERLPDRVQDSGRALALRTALERAQGREPSPDGLLARWQERAPYDPVPVRMRVHALVEQGRFEEALGLTRELAERGAEDEARALEIALAAEVSDWDRAAEAAESGDPRLAAAMRQLAERPEAEPPSEGVSAPLRAPLLLRRAEARLDDGDVPGAIALIHQVLKTDPNDVQALALQVEAYAATTDEAAQLRARCALHHVHPGALGDPASADQLSLSRRCARR